MFSIYNHSVLDYIHGLDRPVSVSLNLIITHSPSLNQSVSILEVRGLLIARNQFSVTQWGVLRVLVSLCCFERFVPIVASAFSPVVLLVRH